MDHGWIKLHRKITSNAIWRNSAYAHLWVTLLMKANHRPDTIMWNKGILVIKEGQFVTGRKALSEDTGIPESTVEDILRFLEKEGFLRQQKNTRFRLITIVNWKDYQQQSDNQPTTSRQRADTNKNVKKDKKNTTAQGADEDVPKLIHLFEGINPSTPTLYARQNQRDAASRLLKLHSLQWWEKFLPAYALELENRFCPRATTPLKMEERLGDIIVYGRQKRSRAIISNGRGLA